MSTSKHPKPHFVKCNGKWQACYGNQSKGSKFRMQMVIAEDVNAFVAHCKYLETLDPQARTAAALQEAAVTGRSGKTILSGLRIAYLRLRGEM